MKTLILYHSKTGFTERYAKWLAEALQETACLFKTGGKLTFPSMTGWFSSGLSCRDNPETQMAERQFTEACREEGGNILHGRNAAGFTGNRKAAERKFYPGRTEQIEGLLSLGRYQL